MLLTDVNFINVISLTSVVGQACYLKNQQFHQVYNRFFPENPTDNTINSINSKCTMLKILTQTNCSVNPKLSFWEAV